MIPTTLGELTERWAPARAAERANFQSYLIELCHALGVEPPRPAGSGYEFEYPVTVVSRDGTESVNFIDLYKEGHFVLEAKDQAEGKSSDLLLRKAFGQAQTYARSLPGTPPPYLLVLDVGKTLMVWDRWSGAYGGFQAARRTDLRALASRPEDVAMLRDIWEDPQSRDPQRRAAAVTREIAETLAQLAVKLERQGHEPEAVATFLIRCVFTMFAEDMGLLPETFFQHAIEQVGLKDPPAFERALGALWQAMDQGELFGFQKLLRFNGHFFRHSQTLPLTRQDMTVLLQAAKVHNARSMLTYSNLN